MRLITAFSLQIPYTRNALNEGQNSVGKLMQKFRISILLIKLLLALTVLLASVPSLLCPITSTVTGEEVDSSHWPI
jgi:hypothetical protein